MPRLMFPHKTKDGQWSWTPEPQELANDIMPLASLKPKEWVRWGFFKDKPMSRRIVALKAEAARDWLEFLLRRRPLPSREVYRLAKLEGISARGVRRAKRYHGIKTIKTGGRQHGWGAQWIWHLPVSK